MTDYYNPMQPTTPHIREKAEFEQIDIQLRALNRALNFVLQLLKYRKVLTANEIGWVSYIKNDVALAKTIDNEGLLTQFLDIASRVSCPKSYEGSLALIRNHKVIGPPSLKKKPKTVGV